MHLGMKWRMLRVRQWAVCRQPVGVECFIRHVVCLGGHFAVCNFISCVL